MRRGYSDTLEHRHVHIRPCRFDSILPARLQAERCDRPEAKGNGPQGQDGGRLRQANIAFLVETASKGVHETAPLLAPYSL